jgi:hypothetical protein
MLNKIETQEIMTKWNARVKYRTQHIVMVITEVVDQCDNDLGYVIYAADDERELLKISRDEYNDKKVAFTLGVAAEPYPQIGNVVYYDYD